MKILIPEQHVTLTLSAYEIDVPDPVPPVVIPPVVVPPVVVPPVAGAFWVYKDGQFNWGGDYSWSTGPIDYAHLDTDGTQCIAVPIVGPWGGWQPFAQGGKFDVSPYKYLTYSVKPTKAGQYFATGFAAINDVADGIPVNTNGQPQYNNPSTVYGPLPKVGVWGTYKIPLADFKLTNPLILKFSIADSSGQSPGSFLVRDVAFTP